MRPQRNSDFIMHSAWILIASVLGMLLLERLGILFLCRNEAGCRRVRGWPILHPNTISLIRIPMGVVSVCFWLAGWQVLATLWFALWMISDLTDGTIARKCDLGTEMGKWLDPLSDKCMYFPVLILFVHSNILPLIPVVLILVIDTVGQFSRLLISKTAANSFGKAKTALITVAISLAALREIDPFRFMSLNLFYFLTISCVILAFLSVYCKIVPDKWYANSLTMANFCCGLAAIWNVSLHHPLRALTLVFMGQFFDLFDGRLARKYGSTRFGAIYDDIADATSFGVAIGFLIVERGRYSVFSWTLGMVYFASVLFRLYRFLHPDPTLPKGIFRGIPSPAGALAAAVGVLLLSATPLASAVVVLLICGLMISRIPYRHLGHRLWPSLPRAVKLVFCVTMLIFVNISIADHNYSGALLVFCGILAYSYLVFGIDFARLRGRKTDDSMPGESGA